MIKNISDEYTKCFYIVVFAFFIYATIRALMLWFYLENVELSYTKVIHRSLVLLAYIFSYVLLRKRSIGSYYMLIILGLGLPGFGVLQGVEIVLKSHANLGSIDYLLIFGQLIPVVATIYFLVNGAPEAYGVNKENA